MWGGGATAHGSTQCCRITVRSEPSAGRRMRPTSGAAAQECGGSGETKRQRVGEGGRTGRSAFAALCFFALWREQDRSFILPASHRSGRQGPFLLFRCLCACERERPQRVHAQVAMRPVHVMCATNPDKPQDPQGEMAASSAQA